MRTPTPTPTPDAMSANTTTPAELAAEMSAYADNSMHIPLDLFRQWRDATEAAPTALPDTVPMTSLWVVTSYGVPDITRVFTSARAATAWATERNDALEATPGYDGGRAWVVERLDNHIYELVFTDACRE